MFESSTTSNVSEVLRGRRWEYGEERVSRDVVARETAIALHYNRTPYVVLMATPSNIEELVLGFSLSEGIIGHPTELSRVHPRALRGGIMANADIPATRFREIDRKRRNIAGRTGCGLCGVEALAEAIRRPRRVADAFRITPEALQHGIAALGALQPLNAATGSLHAAGWMDCDGAISSVREDVGRHNALDKLIGALVTERVDLRGGAAMITSRASFEMVQKAATVGIEMVCAISAPTTLAIEVAQDAGVTLVAFARDGRHTAYAHGERMVAPESARFRDTNASRCLV